MREALGMLIRTSPSEIIEPNRTALLVIDVQNDFVDPAGAMASNGMDMSMLSKLPKVVDTVVGLSREAGVQIIWVYNTTLPHGLGESPAWHNFKTRTSKSHEYTIDGTWGWQLADPLQCHHNDIIIRKSRSSAFVRTNLEGTLRGNGIECVMLVGCMTDGCVESTIRNAAHYDFYPSIVPEACASSRLEWHNNAIMHMTPRYDLFSIDDLRETWNIPNAA